MIETEAVEIHVSVLDSIKAHAQRLDAMGGYEAVGFVGRLEGRTVATATVPLHNHASNPTEAYFVEPAEQFKAEMKLQDEGYEIVGVYHSHPQAEANPSKMDEMLARAGEVLFIYSVVFDELKAYREHDGKLHQIGVSL